MQLSLSCAHHVQQTDQLGVKPFIGDQPVPRVTVGIFLVEIAPEQIAKVPVCNWLPRKEVGLDLVRPWVTPLY